MAYKKLDRNLTFVEMALSESIEKSRSVQMMRKINTVINWEKVEAILFKHYSTGKSSEGATAYHPLILLKCLLLQKWFRINSDPDLEEQINDRKSFKIFLDIPLDHVSPDHSTFCRFRDRLSKQAMREINHEILVQFASRGFPINEGVAIDARLIQSASRPIKSEKLRKERSKKETSEGNLDKNGNPLKFSRDLESDWTVKNEKPHFGQKEHASVDVNHGFILAAEITPASFHDSTYLPYCVAESCHTKEPIKKVYADKGYHGHPNREFLAMNNIEDGIMRKATKNTELTPYEKERNKGISKVRYIVEQYFGLTHLHNNAYRARFTRIFKNLTDTLFRQMAFNLLRTTRILSTA